MIRRYPFPTTVAVLALLAVSASARSQIAADVTIEYSGPDSTAETPLFEVYQAIFSLILSSRSTMPEDDIEASVLAFFNTIGLNEKAASDLFPYVRDNIDRQREYTEAQVAQLCQQRADIESKEQVGDAFAGIYDELDRMQETAWGNFEFLDDASQEALYSYAVMRRSSMQLYPMDAHAAFQSSPETLEQLLERMCGGNSPPSA